MSFAVCLQKNWNLASIFFSRNRVPSAVWPDIFVLKINNQFDPEPNQQVLLLFFKKVYYFFIFLSKKPVFD